MANSSISGNVLGPASSSSAGLVTTAAQTFAGKKTLDGGAAIKGDTSGSAIAAGYVGEVITWASAPSTQNITSTTETDWTNASISLTAGIWLVQATITVGFTTPAATTGVGLFLRITDGSNNIIQFQDKQFGAKSPSAASMSLYGNLSFSFVSILSSTTTHKLRSYISNTSSGTLYNESTARSTFYAVRIA